MSSPLAGDWALENAFSAAGQAIEAQGNNQDVIDAGHEALAAIRRYLETRPAGITPVVLRQRIRSSAPGSKGIWTQSSRRYLRAVPRPRDWVELAPGWASYGVRLCTFRADGEITVELHDMETDDPEVMEERCRLAEHHGWRWDTAAPPLPERTAS